MEILKQSFFQITKDVLIEATLLSQRQVDGLLLEAMDAMERNMHLQISEIYLLIIQ
jgi:hypothetical protein